MNKNILSKLCLIPIIALTITACDSGKDTADSNDVETNETFIDVHLTSTGEEAVDANAQLFQGDVNSDTQVRLIDGDQIWVSTDSTIEDNMLTGNLFSGLQDLLDDHVKLEVKRDRESSPSYSFFNPLFVYDILVDLSSGDGDIWYSGSLPQKGMDEIYYVSYVRNQFESASHSNVVMPEAFDILVPLANEQHNRINDIQVNWSNVERTAGTIQLQAKLSCDSGEVETYSYNAIDPELTSFTIPGETFSWSYGECVAVIEVISTNAGMVDVSLANGRLLAHQSRKIEINVVQ